MEKVKIVSLLAGPSQRQRKGKAGATLHLKKVVIVRVSGAKGTGEEKCKSKREGTGERRR